MVCTRDSGGGSSKRKGVFNGENGNTWECIKGREVWGLETWRVLI